MTTLEATALGLEGLKLRNAIATEAGHTRGCERVFLESVIEEHRHMVPANPGAINAHEIHVCNVVHALQELGLRPRRVCSESLHAVKRRYVILFSSNIAREFIITESRMIFLSNA